MDFSEWVVAKLEEKGWSRSEAARRGGISASMYDKVINGHAKPGVKFIEGFAKAFKMESSEVMKYVSDSGSRASDEIARKSQELLSNYKSEETRRKAYRELQRLADEEKKGSGAASKRSTSTKTS